MPSFAISTTNMIAALALALASLLRSSLRSPQVRGSNIIQGYYQKDAPPIKITDDEGWFRTGDIGEWDEFGGLKITDRIKNTFKLQQGEFVSVEKIEGVVRR